MSEAGSGSYCGNCGAQVRSGTVFCASCGQRVAESESRERPARSGSAPRHSGERGFFRSLFDLSFSEFVTMRLIKVIYIIGIVFISLLALVSILGIAASVVGNLIFVSQGLGGAGTLFASLIFGFLGLVLSLLFWLFLMIALRVSLELTAVLFRIADHTRDISSASRETPESGPAARETGDGR